MLNIIEDFAKSFQKWIIANQSNPILWVGLFLGGILVFTMVYGILSKNH